jgi:hypothetical protein
MHRKALYNETELTGKYHWLNRLTCNTSFHKTPFKSFPISHQITSQHVTLHFSEDMVLIWPSLLSSGQSSWLQIQRSWFNFRRYQIFWEVVGLEQGPLSLVNTIEELFERKISGFDLNREYCCKGSAALTTPHRYIRKKLALTSPTRSCRSIGIVPSRTQATGFVCFCFMVIIKRLRLLFERNCWALLS